MIFLWSSRNEEHIDKHDVDPEEAEEVVRNAMPPYPEPIGDEKWAVWLHTSHGRFLQVLFVYVMIDDVEPDEYARLRSHEKLALEDGEEAVRVIHARDLTDAEKRQLRRRNRGRQ